MTGKREQEIQVDLIRDVASMFRRFLISLDYDANAVNRVAKYPDRMISSYYGATRRLITLRRRKIHKARSFACPEKHRKALAEIESLINTGANLRRHLSTKIKELKDFDTLLKGWGVHHLHLGDRVASKKGKNEGFVKRCDPLLLCYFTETDAYFLDVIDHDSFESHRVVDILQQNWPHLLDKFRKPDIALYPADLSNEDTYKLVHSGYMTFATARDGTVYMPPGGGVMWSRDNFNDAIMTDRLLNSLSRMQSAIVRFLQTDSSATHESPIRLSLCVDRGKYCVRDLDNDEVYEVPEPGVVVRMEGAWGW